jgi:hypothetical protein
MNIKLFSNISKKICQLWDLNPRQITLIRTHNIKRITLESDALDRSAKLTYLYSVRKRNGLNKQKIFCIVMFDKGKTQVLSLIINY